MSKKFLALSCLALAGAMTFGSCNFGTGSGNSENSSTDEAKGNVNAPKQIAGLAEEYYPAIDLVKKQQGVIDVVLVFENTLPGWEALAKEYEKMHTGVKIALNHNYADAKAYQDALRTQIQADTPTWDIVQGNLFDGGTTSDECFNMNTAINTENAYAGKDSYGEARIWSEVLTEEAYLSTKSGSNSDTYIMNTEGLLTAWFVNTVALEAAAAKGYNGGVAKNPETWDELLALCGYMEEAGYENPLGIALDRDSITASQFTWLLRVYGDYYYRGQYQNIMLSDDFVYDPTDINPEANLEYGVDGNAFFYSIFRDSDPSRYVGPLSPRFIEFIEQFQKMRPYLRIDAAAEGLAALRTEFSTQSKEKASPQILLDYVGSGLDFAQKETAGKFKMDFFDYPVMETELVDDKTEIRDVGGNGGYLSFFNINAAQNALNLDFIKFVMSPYGQSLYYEALYASGSVPLGLTTVVNDYVVVPQAWEDFFNTDKVTFNGLVDENKYISFLIRSFSKENKTSTAAVELWQKYLTGEAKDAIPTTGVGSFTMQWLNAMEEDWTTFIANSTIKYDRDKSSGTLKL